jgi:GTPase SAR1 family protein
MGGCCSTAASGSGKGPREATVLVIGLDNSGKTTLTHAINGGE